MRGRLVVVAFATAVLAAGCGGNSHHAAIADYLTRVNDVEQGMAGQLQQVTRVNQSFAKSQTNPRVEGQLAASERTMRRLRHRLAVITAPPEAAKLQRILLELVDREVALTHETHQLAAFVRPYQQALQPLPAASAQLKKKLSASAKGAAATKALDQEKADELVAYAGTAAKVIAALRPLDPPPVWRSTYADQLSSIRQLRSSALALADAIRKNDAAAIPSRLQRFDRAAVANQSIAAQKREIADVKAYNSRIRALVKLAQRAELERSRLQQRYR